MPDSPGTGRRPVAPGQVRRLRRLRTTATYRVVALEGDLVRVRVVEAPGLTPGDLLRFTRTAVEDMDLVLSVTSG